MEYKTSRKMNKYTPGAEQDNLKELQNGMQ